MKIYTKTGDSGHTSLIGGARVPKYDIRIEAYGTIDELISYIGLLRDQKIDKIYAEFLLTIQDKLMTCASILAVQGEGFEDRIPKIHENDIENIEKEIDTLSEQLPPLTNFLLPGGHEIISFCHIARNVCRRAERVAIKANEISQFNTNVIVYLNRLSDYLFVLARKITIDLNVVEFTWQAKL
ncbi:cob(I)yrinic acid a,c-diamide adenosyltransferase [Bacteroidota bacterium]